MAERAVIEKVKKYVRLLIKKGIPIEKAFLYGSYARNEATQSSDIDVMLISDHFDQEGIKAKAKPWLYTAEIDYRIEPISISMLKFISDEASPIIEIVKQEGIEINF